MGICFSEGESESWKIYMNRNKNWNWKNFLTNYSSLAINNRILQKSHLVKNLTRQKSHLVKNLTRQKSHLAKNLISPKISKKFKWISIGLVIKKGVCDIYIYINLMTLTNGKEEERIVYDAHILLFKRIFICWFFIFIPLFC